MKKTFLTLLVMFSAVCGLYANSSEDAQFKEYVQLTRQNLNAPGASLSSDNKYRIIYIALTVNAPKSNISNVQGVKNAMLAEMRKNVQEVKVVKQLKITFVYTFMTSDKYAVCVPISYKDF